MTGPPPGGEKSRGPPQDLVLLLEPPVLAPQPGQLGGLRLLPGERLGRAGRPTPAPPAPARARGRRAAGPPPPPPGPPPRRSSRQPRSWLACPPSSSATACSGRPLSSSSLTASALNSGVNRRRVLGIDPLPAGTGRP